jgi:glycosyltransferase involved in cell wall biosynthesis
MAARVQSPLKKLAKRLGFAKSPALYYVVPGVNWVLDWVGHYVTSNVQLAFGLDAQVTQSANKLRRQIVHYGSLWDLAANIDQPHHRRNWSIGTIFHGHKDAPGFSDAIAKLLNNQASFEKIHTASAIMEHRLQEWGVPIDKIVRIPLGVDTERFRPASVEQRAKARRELVLGDDVICIGSFHKDGQGMAEGNEPKLIKGPDIFLQVIERVSKRYPIFVLLSGPARGFVKRGLDAIGVPYAHFFKEHFRDIPPLYHALDLYLITSREEGGPEGVLESMASGIPLVTTKVGLAPDVVVHRTNGLLADVENVAGLEACISELIESSSMRSQFTEAGLHTIPAYDWKEISSQYYHRLYEPILEKLKSA